MKAENIAESKIMDLLRVNEASCPVCHGVRNTIDSWLESTISNLMHNFEAREKLMSGGLCRAHSKMIVALAGVSSDVGSLGVSMVFEELLERQINSLRDEKAR